MSVGADPASRRWPALSRARWHDALRWLRSAWRRWMLWGVLMLLVLAVLVINALVEVSYVFIDPRLRTGSR